MLKSTTTLLSLASCFLALNSFGQEGLNSRQGTSSLSFYGMDLPDIEFDGQRISPNALTLANWDVESQDNKEIITKPMAAANSSNSYEYIENRLLEDGERIIRHAYVDLSPSSNEPAKQDELVTLNASGEIKSLVRCYAKGDNERCSVFDAEFCERVMNLPVNELLQQKNACQNFANTIDAVYADFNEKLGVHRPEMESTRESLKGKYGRDNLEALNYDWYNVSADAAQKDLDHLFMERNFCQGRIHLFEVAPPSGQTGSSSPVRKF